MFAAARALVVVDKIEISLAQFQNGDVGGCADIERAAIVEARKHARRINRRAGNHAAAGRVKEIPAVRFSGSGQCGASVSVVE